MRRDAAEIHERIAKLPMWVQEHIRMLEQEAVSQKREYAALERLYEGMRSNLEGGSEGATVFVEVGDGLRPIGTAVDVEFHSDSDNFAVGLREGGVLRIESVKEFLIEPSQGFEIFLHTKEA